MENQNQNEKFNIDISLSDEFYRIYKDQANAINYVRNHRNHKCYKCGKYGHIANECGNICEYCKKFHPTTTCLGRLISLLSRILKKMDNSYNKNLVFLNKLIKRNYNDLEWVLSKKNFKDLSISTSNFQIDPTVIYDEDAIKRLQKLGFKNQILKDTIDKCNDEDDNEINNFSLFNQFNKNFGFNHKIIVSEDKVNKYYSVNKINNMHEIDTSSIIDFSILSKEESHKLLGDFRFIHCKDNFYNSRFNKNNLNIEFLQKSFDSIKKKISEIYNEYNDYKNSNFCIISNLNSAHGNTNINNNKMIRSTTKIKELNDELNKINRERKKNSRNKLVVDRLNHRINIIYDLIDKMIFDGTQYIVNKCNNVKDLVNYCESKNLDIVILSKIFKREPICSIRRNVKVMQSYLNENLEYYGSIYKDIKEIKDERKILNKLSKKNLALERSSVKKKEQFDEILKKFIDLKGKYEKKNSYLYEKYKNNVNFYKNKFIKIKENIRGKINNLVQRRNNLYNSIGNMIDRSRNIHSHINRMRGEQERNQMGIQRNNQANLNTRNQNNDNSNGRNDNNNSGNNHINYRNNVRYIDGNNLHLINRNNDNEVNLSDYEEMY